MTKILQYGHGNFLRAFADAYFDSLKKEGADLEVTVVTAIPGERLEAFQRQKNRYHVILRGAREGRPIETVREVTALDRVADPFTDPAAYEALAADPELKLIVSNTTEAGICFRASDPFDGFASVTFPAKLTKFLYARFQAGLPGVYLLPVELIENNADELKKCVGQYIDLWSLPEGFRQWNDQENFYCNTLVDRIVSGWPRDEGTRRHLTELIGEKDDLMTVGEPFGLWAVEKKGEIERFLPQGSHDIDVVLTEDIAYYKKRKVRVLNGSHTNLAPAGLWEGAATVYDCMENGKLRGFLLETLEKEIVPFVSGDLAAAKTFAGSVLDRFGNPYLNHRLASILLNSISKWRARDLPSFRDYYARYGRIAPNLTKGFAYLLQLYKSVEKHGDGYAAVLPGGEIEAIDEPAYLTWFARGGTVAGLMADRAVWGEDLTRYEGFLAQVEAYLHTLEEGGSLL